MVRWLALLVLLGCRPVSIALANRPCDAQGNCVTGYFCDHRANACLPNSQRQPEVGDFSASDGESGRVVLTYTMPDGADGCVVMRKLSVYPTGHDDGGALQIGPEETGTGVKSEIDMNVVNGTTYYYLAVCRAGDAWYDIVNADPEGGNAAPGTPLDPAPANPTDVACSQGLTGKATITFTMPSPPLSDCAVRRGTNDYPMGHGDGVAVGPPLTGAGPKTVSDTGLSNGFYFYAVFCRNGSTYNDSVDDTPPNGNAATADVL